MKPGGGKAKGNSFERKVCRFLTKWVSDQDKELYFWRSPGSGSVFTAHLGNKAISGDVISLKIEGTKLTDKFSIEIKSGYKGANPFKVFGSPKGNDLRDFWIQANRDAEKASKLPMLIYNPPGRAPALVGLCNLGFNAYFDGMPNFERKAEVSKLPTLFIRFPEKEDLPAINLYDLKDLFDLIPYWGNNEA